MALAKNWSSATRARRVPGIARCPPGRRNPGQLCWRIRRREEFEFLLSRLAKPPGQFTNIPPLPNSRVSKRLDPSRGPAIRPALSPQTAYRRTERIPLRLLQGGDCSLRTARSHKANPFGGVTRSIKGIGRIATVAFGSRGGGDSTMLTWQHP